MSENNWGGARKGAGRIPLNENQRKKGVTIYILDDTKKDILKYGVGETFSEKTVEIIATELKNRKMKDGDIDYE